MDPLSLTVATITLLQAATSILQVCYEYRTSLKKAPKSLVRLTEEVASLRAVLESLVKLSEKVESRETSDGKEGANAALVLPNLKRVLNHGETFDQCNHDLAVLKEKLTAPVTGWKAVSVGKAVHKLKWPMTEQDSETTLNRIERLKSLFNLALNEDQTMLALDTRGRLTLLTQSFSCYNLDDYHQKIRQWLSAPDPSSNYNAACKKRQPTTGLWFINGAPYKGWKASSQSMLWLHGIPGCGKTILSSTIIEDVLGRSLSHGKASLAYFYFDFNDREKQKTENLIRSLITQLCLQTSGLPEAVKVLYVNCQNGQRQPSSEGLLETLKIIIGQLSKIYVIMDALDEYADREELLELIQEMNRWRTVQILATSRKEKDIEDGLKPLAVCHICIQDAQADSDIQLYIHQRLLSDSKLRKWPQNVQEEIEISLREGAHGMFRWVVCQLDALRKCVKLDQLRKALSSLPKDLDETYARILTKIDEEGYSKDAFKILQWLAYSFKPLKIEQVVEVIAVDLEGDPQFNPENRLPDPQDIFTICSGLVTMADSELRLAHFSVKEYLVSDRVQEEYSITKSPHANIAQTCLAYLLQFKGPDWPVPKTFKEYREREKYFETPNKDSYPLVEYAAGHWTEHARMADKNLEQSNLLSIELMFFSEKDTFFHWLRLKDFKPLILESIGKAGCPFALYFASLEGLPEVVDNLLKNGEEVDACGLLHGTALQAASFGGYDTVVKYLLEAGAQVNTNIGYNGNALQAASWNGNTGVVQQLLEAGADVNAQGGHYGNALQAASWSRNTSVVQQLLEAGAYVNAQGGDYRSALQAATLRGKTSVVQQLLEAGADVNAPGGHYRNALQAASWSRNTSVAQQLLEAGADVNAQGGDYRNALQAASWSRNTGVVQQLLEAGADVNAPGGYYRNALQAASWNGNTGVAQQLLEAGADVNAQGGHYGSALQAASWSGNTSVVQQLLEAGADADAQEGYYRSALQAALSRKRNTIVEVLVKAGAVQPLE